MRIFLIGLTGSGKTTIGRKLAKLLDLDFLDLDEFIGDKEHKTIEQIFNEFGEDYFRKLETNAIREIIKLKDSVISVGGGAPCFNDNITIMNVSGITVFLDVPIPIITDRLWNQPHRQQRPMIADKNKPELEIFMNELHTKRVEFYREAKLIIKGNNIKAEDIIASLNEMD